jgi:hypothetical protein
VKKIMCLCFLLMGCCAYSPTYHVVSDSYNTYAPVYSRTYTPTSSHVYSPVRTTSTVSPATYIQKKAKKAKKVKKYRAIITGGPSK